MPIQKDFNSFLTNIEPSNSTIEYISSVQNNLRNYLANHPTYKQVHVQTFLSGSYAKKTSIRPKLYDGKRDVDIIVETSYNTNHNSIEVLQEIFDILKEKDTYKNAKIQSHSVGVELNGINIDVVPVVKSKTSTQIYIGSSEYNEWILSDPKGHIRWSAEVNSQNDLKYKPLVKILKWWRRENCPEGAKYPKGITLEKIIADNLPDSNLNTEEHLISTIKSIIQKYRREVEAGVLPTISDPCITGNNLLINYRFSDFNEFIQKLSGHLNIINQNGSDNESWRKILGNEFPKGESEKAKISKSANIRNTEQFIDNLFPVQIMYDLTIDCNVTQDGWRPFSLLQLLASGGILLQNKKLDFYIKSCSVPKPYSIYWKIRNVGDVAESRDCIRGQIRMTDNEHHIENTNFYGPHYVECYIVKNNVCVARKRIDVPIDQT